MDTHHIRVTGMDGAHHFKTADAFDAWLQTHGDSTDEVWVALPKKGTPAASLTRAEALDVALCHGWIDGKANSQGQPEGWWAQRFSPRRARSRWSKINCARVEQLIAEGRMRPAGQRQIDLARADGRWDAATDPPSQAQVPPDLQAALDGQPAVAAAFAKLSASVRFQVLLGIQTAKKPETRQRRIERCVERLAAGQDPLAPLSQR